MPVTVVIAALGGNRAFGLAYTSWTYDGRRLRLAIGAAGPRGVLGRATHVEIELCDDGSYSVRTQRSRRDFQLDDVSNSIAAVAGALRAAVAIVTGLAL